jgi:rapamycin-insensitive companion of mTOR
VVLINITQIRRLSTSNPELCAWSGGINVLLNAIIDPQLEDLSSDIVCTILYLINEPNTRNKTHSYLDISKIFWIFTDIDYNPDKKDKQAPQASKAKMQIQLDLGKKAIIMILKSWVGLVYLGNEMSVLKSFMESLRQKIRPEVRAAIY